MVRPCVARGFVKLASAVLHQCIRSLIGAVLLRTIMDISARAFSLADRPQRAIRVTSVRMRREDRSSISSYPLADLGGERVWGYVIACPFNIIGYQSDWAVAAASLLASKFRPCARTLQAIRASLLASAIANTLRCSRFLAASIQDLSPWRSQLFGLISTTHAACTNRTRR